MRTIAYDVVGDVQVVVHKAGDPNPKEWAEFLKATDSTSQTAKKVLVHGPDVTLSARQRAQIGELTKAHKLRVAIIIRSPVTRGMATAVGWITGTHRAFDPERLDAAFDYIEVPLVERKIIRQVVHRLREELLTVRPGQAPSQ